MELLSSGSEILNSEPDIWSKSLSSLSAAIQGCSCKFRPLKNSSRTSDHCHSIRHQSIPPLSARRFWGWQDQDPDGPKPLT